MPFEHAANRHNVYAAIDTERAYQDARKGNAGRDHIEDNRDLGALILLTDAYLDKAKAAFAGAPHPQGKVAALDQMRKVAALAVLTLEVHGVVPRKPS